MVKQEVVIKKLGHITQRLSLCKLAHPTGGILSSPVTEVGWGRRWAAPGLATSASVCLSAWVMDRVRGGRQEKGGTPSETWHLPKHLSSFQPLSGALRGGRWAVANQKRYQMFLCLHDMGFIFCGARCGWG